MKAGQGGYDHTHRDADLGVEPIALLKLLRNFVMTQPQQCAHLQGLTNELRETISNCQTETVVLLSPDLASR